MEQQWHSSHFHDDSREDWLEKTEEDEPANLTDLTTSPHGNRATRLAGILRIPAETAEPRRRLLHFAGKQRGQVQS
jgi:hypothetical protein